MNRTAKLIIGSLITYTMVNNLIYHLVTERLEKENRILKRHVDLLEAGVRDLGKYVEPEVFEKLTTDVKFDAIVNAQKS